MKLSFHGAARDVTGSCHLLECNGRRILVDCGLFQGGRELREENAEPFGFDAASIDVVLLTHAHLDHCGRLPLLVKRGFRGEILATAATRELARVVMLDSAGIQEEDAERASRKSSRGEEGRGEPVDPLYTTLDALNTLEYFGRTMVYGGSLELGPGIVATFHDAGHILGSASIRLEILEEGRRKSIVFSGDIGNAGRPLLRDPQPPPPADIVVMESTYGNRLHREMEPSVEELLESIGDAFQRGGNVVIPTFALERAQELLFHLREGVEEGRLPAATKVFLDSPMAISATEIYRNHPECYDDEAAAMLASGVDPFGMPGLRFSRTPADSRAINDVQQGAVILAGSGMATGGRVRHHLRHNLRRPESSIVFVSFAAQGTPARQIIDGARTLRLFGKDIPVRAKVHTINGFSAHGDRDELLAWHRAVSPRVTFLVHGEEQVMRSFADVLPEGRVEIPAKGDTFDF